MLRLNNINVVSNLEIRKDVFFPTLHFPNSFQSKTFIHRINIFKIQRLGCLPQKIVY